MTRLARLLGISAVFAGLAAGGISTPAEACIHGMELKVDPLAAGVAEAERLLDTGRPQGAALYLHRVDATLAQRAPGASPLADRALRVFARSTARTGGAVKLGFSGELDTEGAEGKRLDWVTAAMRELAKKNPGEATIATDLAEVLAQVDVHQEEAKAILTKLEQTDLVATGHGYAALARLRAKESAGKPAFLAAAHAALNHGPIAIELGRCARMTKDAAACSLAPPRRDAEPPVPAPPARPRPERVAAITRI